MLVLTRKINESIIIGQDIDIKILALSGNQVKIGIEAPRSVRILRKEVYDEILSGKRENNPSDGSEPKKPPPPPESAETP